MRTNGTELLAIYHSHPTSEPVPSRRDVEENTYGESVVHLIVGHLEAGCRGAGMVARAKRAIERQI